MADYTIILGCHDEILFQNLTRSILTLHPSGHWMLSSHIRHWCFTIWDRSNYSDNRQATNTWLVAQSLVTSSCMVTTISCFYIKATKNSYWAYREVIPPLASSPPPENLFLITVAPKLILTVAPQSPHSPQQWLSLAVYHLTTAWRKHNTTQITKTELKRTLCRRWCRRWPCGMWKCVKKYFIII